MSRRDTIIIAVLINACLLVILFATAVTKQENVGYSGPSHPPVVPVFSPEEMERTLVKEVSLIPEMAESPAPVIPEPVIPPLREPIRQPASGDYVEITVKRGDYLDKIAKENNTSVEKIMSINHLTASHLKIGQVLKVPMRKGGDPLPTPKVSEKQYTVKSGDTLWQIASDHNMQVSELLRVNHLTNETAKKLKPGDSLIIQ